MSSTQLLDLNADCLLEVMQHLSEEDTFVLMEACGGWVEGLGLKRIAQLRSLTMDMRSPRSFTQQQWRTIGKSLTTLCISVGYSLESRHCIDPILRPLSHHGSIEELTLLYVHFKEGYQECVLGLSQSLRHLSLICCELSDDLLQPILERCRLLRTLRLLGNYELEYECLEAVSLQLLEYLELEVGAFGADRALSFVSRYPEVRVKVFQQYRSKYKIYYGGQVIEEGESVE